MEQATFPLVPLGSVLKRADRFERREDNKSYRFAGVYSFSKGLFFREPIAGTTFKLPQIQRLCEGDFVYSKIMAWEGAFALAPAGAHDTVLSGAFLVYEINQTQVLPEYLKFYFQNSKVWKSIGAKSSGTNVRRQSLGPEIFERELFPLPTLDEQQIIVERLLEASAIQAQIKHKQQESATLLTRLRQAILREAVQGRLLPQDPTDEPAPALLARIRAEKQRLIKEKKLRAEKPLPPLSDSDIPYEVPAGWVWCRLGDCIVSAKDGPHFSPQYASKGVPFLSMRNISTSGIDFSSAKFISKEYHEEISKRCKPIKGDILYTKGGTTGIACVNDTDVDFNVWVHVAVLRLTPEIYPFYLKDCLNSPFCYAQSQLLTKGIGNRDLGLQRMVTIPIPLPPLAEQRRIVAKVAELLTHCTELEAELGRARAAASALHAAALREAFVPVPIEAVG